MALRQRLRRRLAREARRAAAVLGRVAHEIDPTPEPAPPADLDGGGPPAHWLAVVRARAPQLLEGRGIGATVADRPVSRAAAAGELRFPDTTEAPAGAPVASAGRGGAASVARTSTGRWPEVPARRRAAAGRWDELGPSHHPVDQAHDADAPPDQALVAWAPAPAPRPASEPGWPALAPGAAARLDWPGPADRRPAPHQWTAPAPRDGQAGADWSEGAASARGPLPAPGPWPERWSTAPLPDRDPVAIPTGRPALAVEPAASGVTFAEEGGWWPDLPPIDATVPGPGRPSAAVPAHGPFDRARVARLDAEQLGLPPDGGR